ncbi:hypothetical protein AQI95_06075 [Streptomyces yokosukanensis]|uniref:Uncharacterized protein n=1 Tax=Streptomyces yokosukanensis TaxID=67386 RepID=A0A101PD89_9ACTN|nr:hypothetical protein AQI95_06075 [Streptomyces yokosukanensis]
MHQGQGEVELLPGAPAEHTGMFVGVLAQPQRARDLLGVAEVGEPERGLEVQQVLADGEGVVEDDVLRAVAETAPVADGAAARA